jgi:hypothetical protein
MARTQNQNPGLNRYVPPTHQPPYPLVPTTILTWWLGRGNGEHLLVKAQPPCSCSPAGLSSMCLPVTTNHNRSSSRLSQYRSTSPLQRRLQHNPHPASINQWQTPTVHFLACGVYIACLQYTLQMSAQCHGSSAQSRPAMHVSTKASTAVLDHRQDPHGSSKCSHGTAGPSYPHTPSSCPLCHTFMLCRRTHSNHRHTPTSSHLLVNKLVQANYPSVDTHNQPTPASSGSIRAVCVCVCVCVH